MKLFSIKDLERFSGVKAHTIRIWEQRYRAFSPVRNSGNTRFYSLDDIERLLCIKTLQNAGGKISNLIKLDISELKQCLLQLEDTASKQDIAINHLIVYMYSDIEKFEDVLDSCVLHWGIDTTIMNIILPFLEKVELLSYNDKSFEAHFVVTAVRKKLILGIEEVKGVVPNGEKALLFLPRGAHYDLFLLYMTYQLKRQGKRVLYLGTDISLENLLRVIQAKEPELIYTYLPEIKKPKVQDFVYLLGEKVPGKRITAVTGVPVGLDNRIQNTEYVFYRHFK